MWHPIPPTSPPPPLPNPLSPNSHKYTHCPANRRVNEDAFAFQCAAKAPTHSSNASFAGEKAHSLALCQNLLLTYFYHPRLCSCVLITNPVAQGGCAWVNRAVGACHVCASGERSLQRWGERWFPVIDSYLETVLMELSKLYANSLFLCRCRCTLLRCTAHTLAETRRCTHSIGKQKAHHGNWSIY